jgi:hypothetical protein
LNQVFIVGFGKFGRLALTQGIRRWRKDRIWIIDSRPEALINRALGASVGIRILADGPLFLTHFQKWIGDEDWIIPAIPIHLAWSWLGLNLKTPQGYRAVLPPENFGKALPFHQINTQGLYLSYADFLCPEKCPSPKHHCYKTKEKRAVPLWKFITDQQDLKGSLGVIESRQIAPGVGGYAFKELKRIRDLARKTAPPFFVATACRCHGVMHGMTWEKKGRPGGLRGGNL